MPKPTPSKIAVQEREIERAARSIEQELHLRLDNLQRIDLRRELEVLLHETQEQGSFW
jgi:hypothetical protein